MNGSDGVGRNVKVMYLAKRGSSTLAVICGDLELLVGFTSDMKEFDMALYTQSLLAMAWRGYLHRDSLLCT